MSISILNRGASGGLKPELTVTAPAGSTIDLLLNSIIVDTYTLGTGETEHTFVVELGTYTVRGTLGEQTKSVEVLIDAVGQYDVEITYKLWLYREGDECEEVTGGWGIDGYSGSNPIREPTKNADNMYFSSTTSYVVSCGTLNSVDFTNYTKLKADVNIVSTYQSYPAIHFCVRDTKNGDAIKEYGSATLGNQVYEIDVSDLNQNEYIVFWVGLSTQYKAYVYNIWLE